MFGRLVVLSVVLLLAVPVGGQDVPPLRIPITPENAAQLTPLTLLSRGGIRDILWSPDGALIALVTGMGVWLYDAADLSAEGRLLPSDAYVTSAIFSEDGAYLAVGYNGSVKVEIWDIATGEIIRTIHRENQSDYSQTVTILDMSFSVDATDTVTYASIIIDNVEVVFSSATASSHGSTFSADGSMMVSVSLNRDGGGSVYVVDTALREVIRERPLDEIPCNAYFIPRVALSPDESRIAVGCAFEDAIHLLNTATLELVQTLRTDGVQLGEFMFSPDGWMLVASGESEIFLWDTASGELLTQLPGFGRAVFSPDGNTLVAQQVIHGETLLHIWNLQTQQPAQTLNINEYHLYRYATFTPGSAQIISVADDSINYRSLAGDLVDTFPLSAPWLGQNSVNSVVGASYSADKTVIALSYANLIAVYGTPPAQIIIVDSMTARQDIISQDDVPGWYCTAVSPNGRFVMIDGFERALWDVETNTQFRSLEGSPPCNFAFTPDGLLIFVTLDGLDFVEPETGEVIKTLHNLIWSDHSFVSLDSKLIITLNGSAQDRAINLWDVETDALRLTIPLQPNEDITALTISPDSTLLAAGGEFGSLWIWDAATGELLFTAREHIATIWQIFFSPDGTLLFTSNTGGLFDGSGIKPIDGATYLWGIPTHE